MNKRFLWNLWKQTENKNKTLLENRNMGQSWDAKSGTLKSECITNTQLNTIIYNKN
jgi:hypothetical protein